MHLVDHARAYIDKTGQRPLTDRILRGVMAILLPHVGRFRLALIGAMVARIVARPIVNYLPKQIKAILALAPKNLPSPSPMDRPQVFSALGERKARVALMTGCAQRVIDPSINESTIRLLSRHGVEVVIAKGAGCCGSLTHHMGKEDQALGSARANIEAWWRQTTEGGGPGLDAIIINISGCGTTVKDYAFMLRDDAQWSAKAEVIAGLARDVTEFMDGIGLIVADASPSYRVAYHSACSMQHGQKINEPPKTLLRAAGHEVVDVPEGHLCCGSAGTYNMLQPEIADRLRDRKVANIERTKPDIIATGNIGCMTQIGAGTTIPIVHTVALLDWATGGPRPAALDGLASPNR